MRHEDVWRALDRLAEEYGLSASGLARRAGLDPTTFNKSKRTTGDGRLRWPSTESLAKVLAATNASLSEFVGFMGETGGSGVFRNIPLIDFAEAGSRGLFDRYGYPSGENWDEIPFPDLSDPKAYGLEITGDALEPLYRDGDILLISPEANTRRGDRVVVRLKSGQVLARLLRRQSARRIDLSTFNDPSESESLSVDDVDWMHRIVLASQ